MARRIDELRAQLRLAVPLAIGHLGHQLMGMVDTAMLGRYNDEALAGAGVANALLGVFLVLGMGVVMGMDSLVPQALGTGDRERARQLFGAGLRLALLISLPLTLLAGMSPLALGPLGVAPSIHAEVWAYTLGRLPGLLPVFLFVALRSYLQAASITRPMVVAILVGNALNVVADLLFIFGDAALVRIGLPAIGLPGFGTVGAALASTVVSFATLAICAAAVRQLHREADARTDVAVDRTLREQGARSRDAGASGGSVGERPAQMRAIVRLGLPVGLQLFAEVGIFALMGALAGRLGTVPAAAHNVALNLASFVFHAIIGVGAATSVRVGLAVGAGDHLAARRAGLTGVTVGVVTMTGSALTFVFAPHFLGQIFTDDPAVVDVAAALLRIAALFQLSDGVQAISAGALRGAGDTRATMWANIAGHYAVGVPLAVLLTFGFDLGVSGLWWGISAGLTVVAIALVLRFLWLSRRPIAPSG